MTRPAVYAEAMNHPLALLPQVTIENGRALLPPVLGGRAEYVTPDVAISAWAEQGAAWVHVYDTDAVGGDTGNYPAIAAASAVHVQLGAGVGDEAALRAAMAAEPSRIVIDPHDLIWSQNALQAHGDLLAVGMDVRNAHIIDIAVTLDQAGCAHYVLRDVADHHYWHHEQRHLLREFLEAIPTPVITNGGMANLDDLHELHELVPLGLDGIILNEPLYSGAFTYPEAVAAGADRFDMFFWGPPE